MGKIVTCVSDICSLLGVCVSKALGRNSKFTRDLCFHTLTYCRNCNPCTYLAGEGGGARFSTPHPEKLKTIFHQAVSHTKKNEYDKAESITLG